MLPAILRKLALAWRDLVHELTDPYRPELHYMRGPGPKSRARQSAFGQGGLTRASEPR
jgi:hypothetical protein